MRSTAGPDTDPLPATMHLATSDPQLAADLFRRAFPEITVAPAGDGPDFRLRYDRTGDGRLAVSRLHVTGSAHGVGSIGDVVGVGRVRHGRFRLEYGRIAVDTTRPYLRPAGTSEFRMRDTGLELLEVDARAFAAATTEHLLGSGLTARLPTPEDASPISGPLAVGWQRIADLVAASAFDDDLFASPLIRAGLFELLVTSMLATFPLAVGQEVPAGDGVRAAAIRRATAYIDEHLAEPLDTPAIAAAARVPVRTLQAGFRRQLGLTPMAHVRLRRLAAARRDLLAADPGRETVTAIARRWGFAHVARFAERYRRTYGENPSETLRR